MVIESVEVKRAKRVSDVWKFYLTDEVYVLVSPSETQSGCYNFVMMIELPLCCDASYLFGQRMATQLDGSYASELAFQLEAERYIVADAGNHLSRIFESEEWAVVEALHQSFGRWEADHAD